MDFLIEPFHYQYMAKAIWICAVVGGVCAFLSAFLMLKGWSLIGDALAHSVVPGVALASILALPYAAGAFISGLLASLSMSLLNQKTKLRQDCIIGLVFTTFFAIGLLLVSIWPTAIDIQGIILGNILAISSSDMIQVLVICGVCLLVCILKWKDFLIVFFDEGHAQSVGISVTFYKIAFFTLLSAACVAALQTVGAVLVIAMVITPGATAYLLTDTFSKLLIIAISSGFLCGGLGAYLSYFLDASPGGFIVSLQTTVFLIAFIGAPKYGLLRKRKGKVQTSG